MAVTHVKGNSNASDSGTSIAAAITSVTAGDLVVAAVKWEGNDTATVTSVTDGTTSFTATTLKRYGSSKQCGQIFYLLSANSGNKTYTANFSASVGFPEIIVSIFNTSTGTWEFDAQNQASGLSATLNSGNIDYSGTDGVVVGTYAECNAVSTTLEKINAVAATEPSYSPPSGYYSTLWYRLMTGTFTAGAATASVGDIYEWVCCVAAFKVAAAGGTAHPYTGISAAVIQTGAVRTRAVKRVGEIQGVIQSGSTWGRGKKRDGVSQGVIQTGAGIWKDKRRDGIAAGVISSDLRKGQGKGPDVSAALIAAAQATTYRKKVWVYSGEILGVIEVEAAAVSEIISGTAKSYTGIAELIGVIEADIARAKAYDGDARYLGEVDSAKGRGKVFEGDARYLGEILADIYRNKAYDGDARYLGEILAERARGRGIEGDARLVAESAYERARSKVYDGSSQLILEALADASYSAGAGTAKSYIGTVQIIGEAESVIARGRAYFGSGQLVIVTEASAVYTPVAPTAWRYDGLSQGVIQTAAQHYRIYKREYVGTVNLVIEVDGSYYTTIVPLSRWTVETRPVSYGVDEAEPGILVSTEEGLPPVPAGQDGAYTRPLDDGAWDEYPVDGAYTDIGFVKEFKPFRLVYGSREGLPSRTSTKEVKPS